MNPAQNLADSARSPAAGFVRHVQESVDAWLLAAIDLAAERLQAPSQQQKVGADYGQTGAVLQLLRGRRAELLAHVGSALRRRVQEHPARWRARAAQAGLPADAPADELAATDPRAPAPPLHLTLISEAQIDDEIETARLVQIIDAAAESELQELAALCSGLAGHPCVEPAAVPLRPADCARALRDGIGHHTQDSALRSALLRALGQAVGELMKRVYAAQIGWLQQHGVQPAGFRIVPTPAATGPGPGPDTPAPEQSMRELVQWARQHVPAAAAAGPAEAGELRLFDRPQALQVGLEPLPPGAAEQLMRGLFAELRRQAETRSPMADSMQRLEPVAQRLAQHDPELWNDPAHPWWQLLDRLLATSAVHDDLAPPEQRLLRQSLDRVVTQVEDHAAVDAPSCIAAAEELQALSSRLLEGAAAPPAGDVEELQRLADREDLEAGFRNQIVQQLRSTPTSGAMRRFLVGPWTLTLVSLAQQHGSDSAEVAAAALVVDDLIRATAVPGQRVSRAQRAVLLRQVGDGLARAALPAPRIDAELTELAAILRDPPPHPEEPQEAWREAPEAPLPVATTLDLHAGLPTVPLALQDESGARATPADWVATLQAGACCRLFLQGQWMTTRLHWVGPGQRLFLFQSKHGGRSHSLTQRMLCKLREAGLATHIEDHWLRAQAMDSLVRHTVT